METDTDPHAILGVAAGATRQEIRRAYRRLALQYHPDHNPDDLEAAERFRQIQAAAAALARPDRRAGREADAAASPACAWGYEVTYPVAVTAAAATAGITCQLVFHGPDGRPWHIRVAVPPGTRHGDRVRVPGAGGTSRCGGARGDLIAVVQIVESEVTMATDAPAPLERDIVRIIAVRAIGVLALIILVLVGVIAAGAAAIMAGLSPL